MKGWIFAGPQQKIWTQRVYRHTSKFQNPLQQNDKHTQILQSALELDKTANMSSGLDYSPLSAYL